MKQRQNNRVSQISRANESLQEFLQTLWPFEEPEEKIDAVDKEFARVQSFLTGCEEQYEAASSNAKLE